MSTLHFPERPADLHKGVAGRVVIVAGSSRYPGAPHLAARAALRAGAGIVTLAVAAPLAASLATGLPEATLLPLPSTEAGEIDPIGTLSALVALPTNALLVGPGLPANAATAALVRALVQSDGPPTVLDAGALSAVAQSPLGLPTASSRRLVLTPHVGEFLALAMCSDANEATVASFATQSGAVVACKGSTTIVASPDGRRAHVGTPNPLLATGGTGDVLAGALAALLATGMEPYEATVLAVAWHSAAGARLGQRLGDAGLLSSELADELPLVRRDAQKGSTQGGQIRG